MESAPFEAHVLGWGEGSSTKIKQGATTSPHQSSLLYFFGGGVLLAFITDLKFFIFYKIE